MKWTSSLTILYDPLWTCKDEVSKCAVADVPTKPLSTWIKLLLPTPVIGPTLVVPIPIFVIFIYSLSIFITSPDEIEDIPLIWKIVLDVLIPVPLRTVSTLLVKS